MKRSDLARSRRLAEGHSVRVISGFSLPMVAAIFHRCPSVFAVLAVSASDRTHSVPSNPASWADGQPANKADAAPLASRRRR